MIYRIKITLLVLFWVIVVMLFPIWIIFYIFTGKFFIITYAEYIFKMIEKQNKL